MAAKDSSLALFAMLQQLPLATLTSIIGTLLAMVFSFAVGMRILSGAMGREANEIFLCDR